MKQLLVLIFIIALCLVSTNQRKRKKGDQKKKKLEWMYGDLYSGNGGDRHQGGVSNFGISNYNQVKEKTWYCCIKNKITLSGPERWLSDRCYGFGSRIVTDPEDCKPTEIEKPVEYKPPQQPPKEPYVEEEPTISEPSSNEIYNPNYKWAIDRFKNKRAPTHNLEEGFGLKGYGPKDNIDFNIHGTWKKTNKKK